MPSDLGRAIPLRSDWEDVKVSVMRDLLRQKFSTPEMASKLRDTRPHELVEGNWWHDCFWGRCTCSAHGGKGENWLGLLLMETRETLV